MEFGRFYDPRQNMTCEGLVDRQKGVLHLTKDSILSSKPRIGSRTCRLADLIPLPCVQAPLVVGAALNYVDHAAEANLTPPTAPLLFGISPGALLGDGGALPFPTAADLEFGLEEPYVDPEAELVAVIGAEGKIVGYAAGNDVSERTWQSAVGQRGLPWLFPNSIGVRYEYAWFKSLPGFKPLGSLYRGDIDPTNISVRMVVNGQVVQDGNTRDMIFGVEELAAETARLLGLDCLPAGTCIYTGTPPGIGYQPFHPERGRPSLKPGDVMTVQLSFGAVTTRIVAR
jgi:2-keto-4-pentenoate hydratase/2-oxohepta-3-ene-1,7-dioic acid hydratase in catechol pathway